MQARIGSAIRAARSAALALVITAMATTGLAAQDLSGTWVFSVNLGATGSGDATFVLEQDGDELRGTYSGALGEHDVHGSVVGDKIEIHFEMDQVGAVTYAGTVTGSEVEGTCEYGELGAGTFVGVKKSPADAE